MTGTAQELIVVGVSTAGSLAEHNLRRLRDYTPAGMRVDDPAWTESAIGKVLMARFAAAGLSLEQAIGGAAAFQAFLSDELLPELLTAYPIEADDLGLAGHSAGGVFASHALLTGAPFRKLILGSFSLELYGETLARLEHEFTARATRPPRQVFAAVGGAELAEPLVSSGMRGGQALLARLQQSAPEALQVTLQAFPDETHGAMLTHLLATGIRVLWPSGQTYMEALPARMRGPVDR
jgi:predicted alpha/beta superfamily hydrolase